ncbi:DPOD2 [Hepatospora eriocheir]|uniref:DPOD2 n=1 Tax=Hepatospora eriocheir TaxID=1081669 RepID=A0A1X0QII7_9MICR|nr:DPOD2 [Hepatospora eriocheir]
MIPNYKHQYNQNYNIRFKQMYPLIKSECGNIINKISQLKEDKECVVIGILFLDSKAKDSILYKKIESDTYLLDDSYYFIEDDTGKVTIQLNTDVLLTTGMVLGFEGRLKDNVFDCKKIVYPNKKLVSEEKKNKEIDSLFNNQILILSNIKFNKNFDRVCTTIDFVLNNYEVRHLFFIGNIFDSKLVIDFNRFNRILSKIDKVFIVPSVDDPTTIVYPLQSLSKMLFPKSDKFVFLTNPVNNDNLIVLDRYLISDLYNYLRKDDMKDDIGLCKTLLDIRNIGPTLPDTIPTYPFTDKDPFFINNCKLMIVGNSKTDIGFYNETVILTIPDFDSMGAGIIFNSINNQIEEIILE